MSGETIARVMIAKLRNVKDADDNVRDMRI